MATINIALVLSGCGINCARGAGGENDPGEEKRNLWGETSTEGDAPVLDTAKRYNRITNAAVDPRGSPRRRHRHSQDPAGPARDGKDW